MNSQPDQSSTTRSYSPLYNLVPVAVCLICFFHIHILLIDDGFIAHRYAANLVRGYGLVFTQGQRVEGISDLSWVLLMTIPQFFAWRPELFAVGLGVASGIAALVVAFHTMVSRLQISVNQALLVVCLAAWNAEYWIAVGNGIETGLYTLVLVSGFALLIHRRLLAAGLMLGFATTLRPESLVLAPIALLCLGIDNLRLPLRFRPILRRLWESSRVLVPWAMIVFGVMIWRFFYYGQLVPNTVIAKSHPLHFRDLYSGCKYLFLFALASAPWVILPLANFSRRLDFTSLLAGAWLSYQLLVIMMNGGDWMFGFRFMNVFFPVLVILSARGLSKIASTFKNARVYSVAALVLLTAVTQVVDREHWTLHDGILQDDVLRNIVPQMYEPYYLNLASVLKPALQPSDIIAPEVLGVVSYVLIDSPMHDWLGLVDGYIAHHGTVYFPSFGKANPVYSVDVVKPAVFAFASGPSTVRLFQDQTGGTFAQRYGLWKAVGQPIILGLRRDREQALLTQIHHSNLQLEPFDWKSSR